MNNYLSELTVIIVTFKTNDKVLNNCLKSINSEVKTLIIENSNKLDNKDQIESEFKNVEVIFSGENLGMGRGNNFGLNKVKTKYALILNPDVICEKNFFSNINRFLSGSIDFTLIGGVYDRLTDYKPAGLFNDADLTESNFDKELNLYDVDWVGGHTILVNLNKFQNKNIFDESFFLFFEETDLCKSVKKKERKSLYVTRFKN